MNTAADDTVHAQDEAVHDSSTHTQADPTIFSGLGNGPQLLSPANVLVGTLVPRSYLQLWAGIDGEEVQSAGAVFEPLPRNALRISHVRELISELKPKIWKQFYQRAGTTKFVRHTSLFEWLSQLGVPLPPLEAWTKQSFGHFHDNICTALDSKESAIAAACKRMQRVQDALGDSTHATHEDGQLLFSQLPAEELLLRALPRQCTTLCTSAECHSPPSLQPACSPSLPAEDQPPTPPVPLAHLTPATLSARAALKEKNRDAELAAARAACAEGLAQRDELRWRQQLCKSLDSEVKVLELELVQTERKLAQATSEIAARETENAALRTGFAAQGAHLRAEHHAALEDAKAQAPRSASIEDSERSQARRAELASLRAQLKGQEAAAYRAAVAQRGLARELEQAGRTITSQAEAIAVQAERLVELRAVAAKATQDAADVHSLRCSLGRYQAQEAKEAARAAAIAREAQPTVRGLTRSLQNEREQREAALAALSNAREQLAQQQVALPPKRACRNEGGVLTKLHPIRLTPRDGDGCGRIDAFGHEMARRLVEECGMTFEAAATANLLVLSWHMRGTPPPEMLINAQFVAKAFERLSQLDLTEAKARHMALPKSWPWAAAADAGNKGREIDMIAISIWCLRRSKPVMEALAAAHLHGDGTGKNLFRNKSASWVRRLAAAELHKYESVEAPYGKVVEKQFIKGSISTMAFNGVNPMAFL